MCWRLVILRIGGKQEKSPLASQKPTTLAGELFVSLPSGGVVTHQEHSEIRLCRVGSGCLSINPYALQPAPQSAPCSISKFGLSVGVHWEN